MEEGEGAWWRPPAHSGRPLSQQPRPVSAGNVPATNAGPPAPRPAFPSPTFLPFDPSSPLLGRHRRSSCTAYGSSGSRSWVLAPVLIQTYLDINVAWVLISLALHPTPASDDTLLDVKREGAEGVESGCGGVRAVLGRLVLWGACAEGRHMGVRAQVASS